MSDSIRNNDASDSVSWIDDPRFAPLFADLLAAVIKQYRVDEANAEQLLRESLAGSQLRALVEKSKSANDIRRTRLYKDAIAAAKGHVYHSLRRYRADDDRQAELITRLNRCDVTKAADEIQTIVNELLAGHASTRERQADATRFRDYLVEQLSEATSVLDLGCGLLPLMFPFESLPRLRKYLAVDSNAQSVAAVSAFARATQNDVLVPVHNDLSDGWKLVLANAEQDAFDVAMMFKFIPVVARQSRELLRMLQQTPARRWIVSGSVTSLTKRTSIRGREDGVLRRFIEESGRNIVAEIAFSEEFVYVVE